MGYLMNDIFESGLSFDFIFISGSQSISRAKRGSKRFCGRIIKGRHDKFVSDPLSYSMDTAELFSDFKLAAWVQGNNGA
jgi:hypothetical protein